MKYYTSSEVQHVLRIRPSTLKNLVDNGTLRKYIPPGRKKLGVYSKEEVDALARARQQFYEGEDNGRTIHRS